MGGLATPAPVLAALFLITTLSSIGLPLLNNFVGEFLVLLGVLEERTLYTVLAATGVVLSAAYMLWMYQRVFLGEVSPRNQTVLDLDRRERGILLAAVALMILMGVRSPFFLRKMDASTATLLNRAGLRETRVERVVPSEVAPASGTPQHADSGVLRTPSGRPIEPPRRRRYVGNEVAP